MHRAQPTYPVDQILGNGSIHGLIRHLGVASFGVEQADNGQQVVPDAVIDLLQQCSFGLGVPLRLFVEPL